MDPRYDDVAYANHENHLELLTATCPPVARNSNWIAAMRVLFRAATILLIAIPQVAWSQEQPPRSPTALGVLAQTRKLSDSLRNPDRDHVLAKIATAQARAGDLEAALTSVKEIEFVPYRQGAIVDVASVLMQRGERAAASQVLDTFVEELMHSDSGHIETSLRDIAKAQVRFDEALAARETCRRALVIIDGLKITGQKDVALRDIADVQAAAKDGNAARQTAQRIEKKSRKNEALGLIARRQAELGDWQEALRTVRTIDDDDAAIAPLIAIVSAQTKSGEMQVADDTIEMIKTKVEKPESAERIVDVAVGTIALALFERGDAERAMERIESVSDPVIKSNSLVRIAEVQEKSGDLKGALESLRTGVRNSWVARNIARLQGKTGDTKGALLTAEKIEDSVHKAWAYVYIVKSQPTTGDDVFVAAILEKASNAAKSGDRRNRDHLLSLIAMAYGKAGNYTGAAKTIAAIQNDRDRLIAISEVAKARSKAGDFGGALAVAEETSSDVEKIYSLIGAAEGLSKVKR